MAYLINLESLDIDIRNGMDSHTQALLAIAERLEALVEIERKANAYVVTDVKVMDSQLEDSSSWSVRYEEQIRILKYLKALLEVNPKASLAATIDLIETTNPESWRDSGTSKGE